MGEEEEGGGREGRREGGGGVGGVGRLTPAAAVYRGLGPAGVVFERAVEKTAEGRRGRSGGNGGESDGRGGKEEGGGVSDECEDEVGGAEGTAKGLKEEGERGGKARGNNRKY